MIAKKEFMKWDMHILKCVTSIAHTVVFVGSLTFVKLVLNDLHKAEMWVKHLLVAVSSKFNYRSHEIKGSFYFDRFFF